MKYIKIKLASNGTATYTEETIFTNENLATRLEINFQSADVSGYDKWVDFLLADGQKMTLPLLADVTTGDILIVDLDDSLTIEGPIRIQPWASKSLGIGLEVVKSVWTILNTKVKYSINNDGQTAFDNPDLIQQLFNMIGDIDTILDEVLYGDNS